MATQVSVGASVIAVPSGPPQPNMKHAANGRVPQQSQHGPAFHPAQPHMLHWDGQHLGGQILPLRQPVPPVYYNNSCCKEPPSSEGKTGKPLVLGKKVPGCRWWWKHIRVQQHIRWSGWWGSSSEATAVSPDKLSAHIWTSRYDKSSSGKLKFQWTP